MLPFLNDPKKMATIIIAGKPGGEEKAPDLSPKEVAAEELLSALSKKDPKALAESLESFIKLCGEEEYAEEEA